MMIMMIMKRIIKRIVKIKKKRGMRLKVMRRIIVIMISKMRIII